MKIPPERPEVSVRSTSTRRQVTCSAVTRAKPSRSAAWTVCALIRTRPRLKTVLYLHLRRRLDVFRRNRVTAGTACACKRVGCLRCCGRVMDELCGRLNAPQYALTAESGGSSIRLTTKLLLLAVLPSNRCRALLSRREPPAASGEIN